MKTESPPPGPSTSAAEEVVRPEIHPEPQPAEGPTSAVPKRREIPIPPNYGKATYALSRHRKNKVLVWQSKTLPGRVYEFVLATRFRVTGLYSWKCLHCSMLKQKMKKEGEKHLDKKIPLLLVDNDVIKENPDRPNNGAHFCEGRDVVDATVLRTKLIFYDAFAKGNFSADQQQEAVEMGATTVTPFTLTTNEKETVRSLFNEKAVENMNRVIRKRKTAMHAKTQKDEEEELPPELDKPDPPLPPPPRAPVKRMVKLKALPPTPGLLPMELKKATVQKMEAKKVIVQKTDYQQVTHPTLLLTYRVPVVTRKFVPIAKPVEQPPLLPPAAPFTPLSMCLDPEEADDVPDGDEFIDVEGVDSS